MRRPARPGTVLPLRDSADGRSAEARGASHDRGSDRRPRADGRSSDRALVSTDGSVDWFCCPRFDSPSVFGVLLDDDHGGHFRIRSARGSYEPKQMCFPETAVLITRFISENGLGEVVDFMPPTGRDATDNHRSSGALRAREDELRGRGGATV
jgi:GH15 family glucan-1,4-alpha-glucosidase